MPEYRITIYAPDGRLDFQLLYAASSEKGANERARVLADGKRFTVDRPRQLHCNGELSD